MNQDCSDFIKLMHSFKRTTCRLRPKTLASNEIMTLITIQHLGMQNEKQGLDGGVKVSDISERLKTSKPDVSKKIRLLEEKQLVCRVESKVDKRVTYIHLTDKGRQELEKGRAEAEQFMENVFKRLGSEDTSEFMRLCKRMLGAMEDEIKEKKEREEKNEENI